ncbi:MAG TPA: Mg2+ and Co2+ transporter CorB [Porticoccaceae bacterium]|nr:Mg2+ and Co2+ transporter CorB [Porticoccaceae bacterium]
MSELSLVTLTWIGIVLCLSQSAIFSGLNLALFGISRLRLEAEVATGNEAAKKILAMRRDSNFLLTTILWGNVGINVLLTLLSDSVMAGASAFLFSTIVITFFGEITPQAYFSRNALRMGAMLSPVLRFYQLVLFPFAKPSALVLDWWLGKEGIQYFREHNLRAVIKKHIEAEESDIDRIEGLGALNFLAFDDLLPTQEGEPVDPKSIIGLPVKDGRVEFPPYAASADDPFIQRINASGKKWVIITDSEDQPRLVLNANAFLRNVLSRGEALDPSAYTHSPLLIRNDNTLLGKALSQLKVKSERDTDDVIDEDLILLWGLEKRVITGADILGRLLRGIALRDRN